MPEIPEPTLSEAEWVPQLGVILSAAKDLPFF
jgi:hypothetical protein